MSRHIYFSRSDRFVIIGDLKMILSRLTGLPSKHLNMLSLPPSNADLRENALEVAFRRTVRSAKYPIVSHLVRSAAPKTIPSQIERRLREFNCCCLLPRRNGKVRNWLHARCRSQCVGHVLRCIMASRSLVFHKRLPLRSRLAPSHRRGADLRCPD